MTGAVKILCLEDLPEDAELARGTLQNSGLWVDLVRVDTEADFRRALNDFSPELVLCGNALPGFDGLAALAVMKEESPGTPVIMFTRILPDEQAVACVKAGAADYVLKGNSFRLPAAVRAALKVRRESDLKSRAESALRESESRFRTLVSSAPDAIVTVDSDGIVQLWNAAAEDIFGYSTTEMVGASIQRVMPERIQPTHAEKLRERLASGEPLRRTVTVTARRKDGTEFPAELSLSSVAGHGSTSFTAVIRDRTEALEAQRAIEELSHQHELLLNTAGEGILGVAADGTVTFANPAALKLLGRKASELVGERTRTFLRGCGDEDPDPRCPVLSSLRTGASFRGDCDFLRADGASFPAAVSLTPLKEGDGLRGGVLIFEDITHRKRQEAALLSSEASYRSLVDNAPYGIYRSTPAGHFVSVNPALVTILGYESREELLALELNESLYRDPEDRARFREAIQGGGPTFQFETVWLKKDGTHVKVRLTGRVVAGHKRESDAYEVLVEDLTERTALENQLRQAQKMETVGQLTGGIAHDFNNVLAVILLNTELAIAALDSGAGVDREDLTIIQDAARRAGGITRKLLGFSRRADLQREPTRLSAVATSLSGMLRTALPESIELVIDADDDAGSAFVDAGSIEQMILNLVTNSRDALPEGGRVTLTVRDLYLDKEECRRRPGLTPGRHVCVQVADDGIGMDAETLRRVFDPFFTTKASGVGTGLGMAMVYGLTKQQGGFVQVDSEQGLGTATCLYFPVCQDEAEGEVDVAYDEGHPHHRGTILVVEDEDNLRAVATRALTGSGFRVLSAANGDDALDIF
ncbi:MAG TPA: PAS domain S-box protein, partial [Longimicrobiales bacterium]|nr:PAS domain S-box protein [Longimicrobiales bacterium]